MTGPRRTLHSSLVAVALIVTGCPARFVPGRTIVSELNLQGVHNVDEDALRNRVATKGLSGLAKPELRGDNAVIAHAVPYSS